MHLLTQSDRFVGEMTVLLEVESEATFTDLMKL